jgi:hypothetical protein
MMTIPELQELLDTYGADPAAWPPQKRGAAERLIADEPLANEAFEKATRLDLLLSRALRADLLAATVPANEAATGLINALAAGSLPRQRRGMLAWAAPSSLLDFEFAPAWPRVAALASVAILGFGIGLFGLDLTAIESLPGAAASATAADPDLNVVAFDPEPLTGVRP